jgi:hypothetical protein
VQEWPPNPFVYDRPLEPEELIDREREVDELVTLAEGGHTSRVSAPRRYGKTTLLRAVLAEADRRGVIPVYVDLWGTVSMEQITERIAAAYRSQLQGPIARTAASVIETLRPRIRLSAGMAAAEIQPALEREAFRRLERMLDLPLEIHKRNGRRTLVVFDEFQEVLRAPGNVDAVLRSHIQHQLAQASYIFAGSHPGLMLALFEDRERPFYGQARPIPLQPLEDAAIGEYVAARFEQTRRAPGEALDPLLDLAAGHPQRAMLLAHHLWNATARGATAGYEAWAEALDAVDRHLGEGFANTWDRLTTNQARVLSALASSDESLFSSRTLAHFGLTKSGAEQGRDALIAFGDVQDLGRGRLVVLDPLLERWVRERRAAGS